MYLNIEEHLFLEKSIFQEIDVCWEKIDITFGFNSK